MSFPNTKSTFDDLLQCTDFAGTTLLLPMASSDTTITVVSATFAVPCILIIDRECVKATATNGQTVTVVRGFNTTTAVPHIQGSRVLAGPSAYHMNTRAQAIIDIENALGLNMGNVASSAALTTTGRLGKVTASGALGQTLGLFEDATGKVGIGTIGPGATLAVVGNTSTSLVTSIQDNNPSPGGQGVLRVLNNASAIVFSVDNVGSVVAANYVKVGANGLRTTDSSTDLVLSTNATERMRILSASGNVGIGITPGALLHVAGANAVFALDSKTAGTQFNLQFLDGGTGKWDIYKSSDNTLRIYDRAGAADVMVFKTGGNVGIGTVNPSDPLTVIAASYPYLNVAKTDASIKVRLGVENTYPALWFYGTGALVVQNATATTGITTVNFVAGAGQGSNPLASFGSGPGMAASISLNQSTVRSWALINVATAGDLQFNDGLGAALTLQQTTHNVGIGTTAPLSPLSVTGGMGAGAVPVARFNRVYATTGDSFTVAEFGVNGDRGLAIGGTASSSQIRHNSEFISNTGEVARATFANQISTSSTGISFMSNAGLTSGSVFTPTTVMIVTSSSTVGIGTTTPLGKLHVADVNRSLALDYYNAYVTTTDAQAADVGGSLAFGGRYVDSSATLTMFASIAGRKANATSTDYGGYLSLAVRAAGSGAMTEAIRIAPSGNVGIGITAPADPLSVYSTAVGGTSLSLQNASTGGVNWRFISEGSGSPVPGSLAVLNGSTGKWLLALSASGNLAVGPSNTSAGTTLHVYDATATTGVTTFAVVAGAGQGTTQLATFGALYLYSSSIRNTSSAFYLDQASIGSPIYIRTSASSLLDKVPVTVLSSGAVGIGTTAPGMILDIKDTTTTAYNPASVVTTGLRVYNSSTTGYATFMLQAQNTASVCEAVLAAVPEDTTTTNTSLTFATRDTTNYVVERMRITHAGAVGIGTTAPVAKFVVSNGGAAGVEVTPGVTVLGLTNANQIASYDRSGGAYRDLLFDLTGTAVGNVVFKAGGNIGFGLTNPAEKLHITGTTPILLLGNGANAAVGAQAIGSGDLQFGSYAAANTLNNYLYVKNGGNVGIGTTAPGAKLQINDTYPSKKALYLFDTASGGGSGGGMTFGSASIADGAGIYLNAVDASNAQLLFQSKRAGVLTTALVVDSTSNVGIGTTTPGAKLQVAGGALQIDVGKYLTTGPADNYTYSSQLVGYNSVGWFTDSWDAAGATAWLNGYAGIKFFTGTGLALPTMSITRPGKVGIGLGNTAPVSTLHVYDATATTGNTMLTVQAGQGQLTYLQQWLNYAGTMVAMVAADGNMNASGLYVVNNLQAGGSYIQSNGHAPASSTATGVVGQHAWDASYIYICTATNTWKRAALTTF